MARSTDLDQTKGVWHFVIPLTRIEIAKDLSKAERKFGTVTFCSTKTATRAFHRRMIVCAPWMEHRLRELAEDYPSAAVVEAAGRFGQVKRRCIDAVEQVLDFLRLYCYMYFGRSSSISFGIAGDRLSAVTLHESVALEKRTGEYTAFASRSGPVNAFELCRHYLRNAERGDFQRAKRILFGEQGKWSPKWREAVIRAIRLAGRSRFERDRPLAFMFNIVALETLLTDSNKAITDSLSLCATYLCEGAWERGGDVARDRFKRRIVELYDVRSKFVHQGRTDLIDKCALLDSDDVLFNCITNVIVNARHWRQRQELVVWAKRRARSAGRLKKYHWSWCRHVRTAQDLEDD
jgi:hypothetical protein